MDVLGVEKMGIFGGVSVMKISKGIYFSNWITTMGYHFQRFLLKTPFSFVPKFQIAGYNISM